MIARGPDTSRAGGRAGWTAADGWLLLALVCFVAGAITLIVTWYEISGQALLAEQVPYLASGGLGGLALFIAGAGCLSAGRSARIEARLVELLSIATEPITDAPGATAPAGSPASLAAETEQDSTVMTVTGGTTYHRSSCRLLSGKETSTLSLGEATQQGLTPCPVCH